MELRLRVVNQLAQGRAGVRPEAEMNGHPPRFLAPLQRLKLCREVVVWSKPAFLRSPALEEAMLTSS